MSRDWNAELDVARQEIREASSDTARAAVMDRGADLVREWIRERGFDQRFEARDTGK